MASAISHSWMSWLKVQPSMSLARAGTTGSGGEEGCPSSVAKPCRSASLSMPCAVSFYAQYRLQNPGRSALAILHKHIPLNFS
jgi:hypothetical protein